MSILRTPSVRICAIVLGAGAGTQILLFALKYVSYLMFVVFVHYIQTLGYDEYDGSDA